MNDFYKTRMGMTFFEHTLPTLVREIARLNENLEKSREQAERHHREIMGDDVGLVGTPDSSPG